MPRIGRSVITWVVIAAAPWWAGVYAAIVFGVFAAVVHHHHGGLRFHLHPRIRLALVAVIAMVAVLLAQDGKHDAALPFCSIAIVLPLTIRGTRSRLGALAGGLSYPLYLNHWIGIFFARALLAPIGMRNSWLAPLIGAVVSIGMAAALYWWMDRRLQMIRGKLYTPSRGVLAMRLGYALVSTGIVFGLVMTHA